MRPRFFVGIGGTVALLVAAVVVIFAVHVRVDEGEACAVTRFGKLVDEWGPGFHLRNPLWTGYHCFSAREVIYEASRTPEESGQDYRDFLVDTQSSDGQTVSAAYSIAWSVPVDNVRSVYQGVGQSMDQVNRRVVVTLSRSEVRNWLRKYEAERLFSGDIYAIQTELETRLRERFEAKGVRLHNFTIRELEFDPEYAQSIEGQQIAQEQIETESFRADAAAEEARRRVALAKGEADSVIERARGEAESIRLRGDALERYPAVLQLEFVGQLDSVQWGILPDTGIQPLIPVPPGSLSVAPTEG